MKASRRSALRNAAIAAGTVTALALPVGSAFADSPTLPGTGPSTPSVQPENPETPDTKPAPDTEPDRDARPETRPEDRDKPQDQIRTRTVALKDGGTAKVDWILGKPRAELFGKAGNALGALEGPGASKTLPSGLKVTLQYGGTLNQAFTNSQGNKPKPQDQVDTKYVNLKDGGVAHVNWILGKPRAELFGKSGKALGALEAPGACKTLPSGLRVTLNHGGTLTQTWHKDTRSKPKPEQNTQRKIKLKDGSTALVEKGTDNVWGATVWSDKGGFLDGVHAVKRPTVKLPSGLKITIGKDGKLLQQWPGKTGGKTKDLSERTTADRHMPRGGVKAGAESSAQASGSDSGDATMLLATGGGAAAAAAGLGFTMLRRRRNDTAD
ncbi:hypothetical protein [Streptomyces sp. NPDC056670]|uniref:hypothetical protein n=1 Tax=Streptomyces sp. NPDC056670 TaxID=3345904 RepID=UPI0036B1E4BA